MAFARKLLQMDEKERKEYLHFLAEKQQAEKKRLDERLEEMKLLDTELKNAPEEAEPKDQESLKK